MKQHKNNFEMPTERGAPRVKVLRYREPVTNYPNNHALWSAARGTSTCLPWSPVVSRGIPWPPVVSRWPPVVLVGIWGAAV